MLGFFAAKKVHLLRWRGKQQRHLLGFKHWYMQQCVAHLNRDQIESNLSVPGIQGCHVNTRYKSIETSPHFICLYASTKIPLGPA